jgi:hypothetical protein
LLKVFAKKRSHTYNARRSDRAGWKVTQNEKNNFLGQLLGQLKRNDRKISNKNSSIKILFD